jgi:hypothetical protein
MTRRAQKRAQKNDENGRRETRVSHFPFMNASKVEISIGCDRLKKGDLTSRTAVGGVKAGSPSVAVWFSTARSYQLGVSCGARSLEEAADSSPGRQPWGAKRCGVTPALPRAYALGYCLTSLRDSKPRLWGEPDLLHPCQSRNFVFRVFVILTVAARVMSPHHPRSKPSRCPLVSTGLTGPAVPFSLR